MDPSTDPVGYLKTTTTRNIKIIIIIITQEKEEMVHHRRGRISNSADKFKGAGQYGSLRLEGASDQQKQQQHPR